MKIQNREAHQLGAVDLAHVVDKLSNIERLLLLLAAKLGADSNELAMALGVSASTVKDRLSFRKVRRAMVHAEETGADTNGAAPRSAHRNGRR